MLIVIFSLTEHRMAPSGESLTFDGGSKTIATPVLDVALVGLLFRVGLLEGLAEGDDGEEGIEVSVVGISSG